MSVGHLKMGKIFLGSSLGCPSLQSSMLKLNLGLQILIPIGANEAIAVRASVIIKLLKNKVL